MGSRSLRLQHLRLPASRMCHRHYTVWVACSQQAVISYYLSDHSPPTSKFMLYGSRQRSRHKLVWSNYQPHPAKIEESTKQWVESSWPYFSLSAFWVNPSDESTESSSKFLDRTRWPSGKVSTSDPESSSLQTQFHSRSVANWDCCTLKHA
ncbi:hypothetical protein AVEN_77158-1 [Araneus ventricosus]|uniref:Uncharacterized protein n=1 Tax=Araneus ventricosus TaxID=182803 RepID=A0A4Y2IDZ4_ARAVE|nr:hypothetical protein AVEN_77158-1 [Araneus ventricosus]